MTTTGLGVQCHATSVFDGCAAMLEGEPVIWLALNGSAIESARMVAFAPGAPTDALAGHVVRQVELPGMSGPRCVLPLSDGTVYAGGYESGALYRWRPGMKEAQQLGTVLPDTTFLWHLAWTGTDVVGGTYPHAAILRWTEREGMRTLGPTPMAPEAHWARQVAYDPSTGYLIASCGTPCRWFIHDLKEDPSGHTRFELDAGPAGVGAMGISAVVDDGLAVLVGKDGGIICRIERASGAPRITILTELDDVTEVRPVVLDSALPRVAYCHRDGTIRLHGEGGPEVLAQLEAARGPMVHWPATNELLIPGARELLRISLAPDSWGQETCQPMPELPRSSQATSTLGLGHDDVIWSGCFLSGGLAAHDPATGRSHEVKGLPQPEGIARWGDGLFVGSYPGGNLHWYGPGELSGNIAPAKPFLRLHDDGQDRPWAFAEIDDTTAWVACMADYGRLPGGLVRVHRDAATGGLTHEPVTTPAGDRSIVALVRHEGFLYGATSTRGGMGVDPTEASAVLLRLDETSGRVDLIAPPLPEPDALHGLVLRRGEDGPRLWTVAGARLCSFDPATEQWRVLELPAPWPAPEWAVGLPWGPHAGHLGLLPDGRIVASLWDVGVLAVTPERGTVEELWHGRPQHLVVDGTGAVHVTDVDSLELVRIVPQSRPKDLDIPNPDDLNSSLQHP